MIEEQRKKAGLAPLRAVALALLLAGGALRIYQLGAESFWLDEVYSAQIVEGAPGRILDRIPPDKPPLDYYMQSLAARLPLEPETSHRLPAAVAGVAALVLTWGFARKLFGEKAAWATLALVSAHAFLIHYSREARSYSPAVALLIAQMWLFWTWREKPTVLRTVSLGAVSVAALYTLYAAVAVLGCELLYMMVAPVFARTRLNRRGWGRAIAAYFALIVVVLLATLPLRGRINMMPPEDYFWKFELRPMLVARWIAEHLAGPAPVDVWAWLAAIAMSLLAAIGLVRAWRHPQPAAFITLISVALPCFIVVGYALVDHSFWSRYTVYCVPGLCMLEALGAVAIGERLKRPLITPAIILIAAGGMLALHAADRFEKPDWRGAARYVRERIRPGDKVIVSDRMFLEPLEYYMRRESIAAPLIVSADGAAAPEGPYWRVDYVWEYPARKRGTVHGIQIEPLGQTPAPGRLRELAARLGDPPVFRPGGGPAELLGAGWSHSENWGSDFSIRWLTQTHSWFFLPLETPRAGRLTIKLMPFVQPQGPPQTIRPSIGRFVLERRTLAAGFSTQTWEVPAGALAGGYNRIELELGWVHSPSKDKANYGDFRMLGAAVSEIGLTK